MRLPEKILLLLSRDPDRRDYQTVKENWNLDNALTLLCRVFPDFMDKIAGKTILDFGCGMGFQSIVMAMNGAKYVLGIDINQIALNKGRCLAKSVDLDTKVEFNDRLDDHHLGAFDMVISQNSMEHFGDPVGILMKMKSALRRDGVICVTFMPPWYAPYGSHMHFFTKVPWVNILFSEKTVMTVRSRFRNDGATKYEQVEGGLNKMTVSKFKRIVSHVGMKIQYERYQCIKGLDFLSKPPLLRELFINQITCEIVNI